MDIEMLAKETNRKTQWIYRLAKRYGRLPTKEEVLSLKKGRPRIYK